MISKYFDVNENGCSIRCKIYANDVRGVKQVIVFGHGFGGHRDAHAAQRFAEVCLSKYKTTAVITFDWPCHGSDARNKLTMEGCELYLQTVLGYIHRQYQPQHLFGYATSFGGYQFLRYIYNHGNPFERVVLRCPSVAMHDVFLRIMTEEELERLERGKEVPVGFDRKVKITKEFFEELKREDLRGCEFFDYADDILILHGTKDEIVPYDMIREFAENNVIEFAAFEGVDHRFRNADKMDLANSMMIKFLLQ